MRKQILEISTKVTPVKKTTNKRILEKWYSDSSYSRRLWKGDKVLEVLMLIAQWKNEAFALLAQLNFVLSPHFPSN